MDARLILVHDDENAVCEMMTDALGMFGHHVIGMTAPLDSETLYVRNGPDLMIVDLMLNGRQNGIEFALAIRERGYTAPLIGFSASDQMRELAASSGVFSAVLRKPLDIADLLAAVDESTAGA